LGSPRLFLLEPDYSNGDAKNRALKALVYYQQLYGGNYEGDGGQSGSSQDRKIQFIILY
jgi:hypothetical protein